MDDQRADQDPKRVALSSSRAGVLFCSCVVVTGLILFTGVLDSWPRSAQVAANIVGGAWPLVYVGRELSGSMKGRPWRFSLRAMLVIVAIVSLILWTFIQLDWIEKRERWRRHNRAAIRSTQGQAPPGLVRLFEPGVSRIEIKNGTKEQIAEASRLFPEATVVVADEALVRNETPQAANRVVGGVVLGRRRLQPETVTCRALRFPYQRPSRQGDSPRQPEATAASLRSLNVKRSSIDPILTRRFVRFSQWKAFPSGD